MFAKISTKDTTRYEEISSIEDVTFLKKVYGQKNVKALVMTQKGLRPYRGGNK